MSTTTAHSITSPRLIVTVDDEAMLSKVRSAIKMLQGVSNISVLRSKKSDLELAREDAKAGRVTKWNSVDELFDTVLAK